ncbi:MAG: hypothetical protein LUO98_01560 [Methanoregula sp.]|nr:hypothetical protein [Methanoregula sp.]
MVGLVALCLLLVLPAGVSAISVTGSKYLDSIKPGGTDTHTMTVSIGAGEDPTEIQAEVYGFGQNMDQGYSALNPADDTNPYSARSIITLDNSSLHLEPGVAQSIHAKISVPANAGPGGRYALIYIHALPGKGKSFTTAVLVPVLITIAGTTPTMTGSITDLSVGTVTVGQPITVITTLKNTGNYHYYHTVNTIAVRDEGGNLVGNFSTRPSVYAIIPGNTVRYTATPKLQDLPVGTYTVNSKVLLESGTVLDEKTTTFSITTKYIPPVTESSITLTPGSAGTLTSPDGRISVSFPQGSVLADVVVTLKPYAQDKLRAAPFNAKLGATSFEVAGLAGLLSKDATVRVTYSADDLAAAGGDASQLKLAYYDAAKGGWVILPTQVNMQDMTLTTTTNHMGIWVVMVSSSIPGSSPAQGATGGILGLPLPPTVILASLIIAVCIAGNRFGKRK